MCMEAPSNSLLRWIGCNSGKDRVLDVFSSDTPDRSRCGFSSAQQCRTDIEPIANAVLAGKARAHPVALVVEELALKQGAALGALCLPAAVLWI